jgi:dTDP-4-dehydrorhamnose reductase
MRVLIVGASGQLGSDLMRAFADQNPIGLDRKSLDIEKSSAISRTLGRYRPDLVINTAAFHNVEVCETQPERAFAVNALAVDDLAAQCALAGIALAHISTDYVFDGKARAPYPEDAATGPLSAYGASKLAGELLVKRHYDSYYIIRTSGLYGIRGSSVKGYTFIERILTQAQEGRPLDVVNDITFSPSYTRHVAEAVRRIVERGVYGTYHVTNDGRCTWYEFAREILAQAGISGELRETTSERFPTLARRPKFSALKHGAMDSLGLPLMPLWTDGIRDYLRERSAASAHATPAAAIRPTA